MTRMTRCNGVAANDRGIALLVTLAFIAVAVAIGLQAHRAARAALSLAAVSRDRDALTQMAASGVQTAMAILIDDRLANDIDGPTDAWASPQAVEAVTAALPFETGQVTVRITDERSRIQLNALVEFPEGRQFNEPQRLLLTRFLENWQATHDMAEPVDTTTVVNALKDWLDSGDDDATTCLTGAEAEYYRDQSPATVPANGPLHHTGELAGVRGVTRELMTGAGEAGGIFPFVTVFGATSADGGRFGFDGKININTADAAVIAGLLDEDLRDLAGAITEYRAVLAAGGHVETLADPTWYKQAPGCGDITIDPALVTLSSDVFRIESTARSGAMRAVAGAVVARYRHEATGQWDCRILFWESS
ncbi:MAG: general secretion pathway protein GspK [Pseudomonadota bacterium]